MIKDIPSKIQDTYCPAQELMGILSGKWKMHILHLTLDRHMRFSDYLREIRTANRQSLSVALKDLQNDGLLIKEIVNEKPLHVQYSLSTKAIKALDLIDKLHQVLM
ncbi:winged helix-turn-helix transcriptional regulator [Myroides sp. LJL119]